MTREQRRRRKRLETVVWALGVLTLATVLCVSVNAAFDAEAVKNELAVTGAFVWAWLIMRAVLWLDTIGGAKNGRND